MEKSALRRSLLQTRKALSQETWQTKSAQICAHLQAASQFQQARTILAYFSVRQEPDLSALFGLNKVWGFSRCVNKSLIWHRWSAQDAFPLQTGTYGIPEPHPHAPMIQPHEVDLILVPCVACDNRGYRLGYGGGFYDRFLSAPAWATKITIGITFDFAYLKELPIDEWDCPLQGICTEQGLYWT